MSEFGFMGLSRPRVPRNGGPQVEMVTATRPLRRILAFSRRSIDDVVNSLAAKSEVYGYYKLYRQIDRMDEVRDLEKQWNPLGVR